jgi:long-chain acyl-CoA synthetase
MTATDREIIAFCRKHLGRFQVPRIVEFVPALPKNATGKILKRAIPPRKSAG